MVGSVLETLGSRGVSDRWSDPVCFGTSHRSHAMPPRRTRNSDRPRASDRTMVATESNRLPSFKDRPAQSPRENETKGTEEQSREEPLERSRGLSANSGLDIETKIFSATSRRRSFFVDIPFYRTTYLKMKHSIKTKSFWEGFRGPLEFRVGLPPAPQDLGRKPTSHRMPTRMRG